MKKLHQTLLALLFITGFSSTAIAQNTAIKINILSPIVSTASLFVEHAVGETSSIQLGGFYTGASIGETKFRGFGITPEFRYYLSDQALDGFYLGPFLRYQNFDLTDDLTEDEATFSSFGGGLVIGRQWLLKERITIDLFGGPAYNSQSIEVSDGSSEEQFDTGAFGGFGVRIGVTIGVAF